MSYQIVYKEVEILGIMPPNGWMYPEHDRMFDWFAQTFPIYHSTYKQISKNFDVAIQAGGHVGIGPMTLSTLFKTVYTFEPNPHSFHCLVNNCQNDNIIKMNCCLGKDHKLVYQYFHGQHNVGVSLFKEQQEGIEPILQLWDVDNIEKPALVNIPQVRIDDLGLEQCDLIHLDVEGYEGKVIEGGVETISRFKPAIVFETMNTEQLEWLHSLGYYKPDIKDHQGDSVLVCH